MALHPDAAIMACSYIEDGKASSVEGSPSEARLARDDARNDKNISICVDGARLAHGETN